MSQFQQPFKHNKYVLIRIAVQTVEHNSHNIDKLCKVELNKSARTKYYVRHTFCKTD